MAESKAFLGIGWKFPINTNSSLEIKSSEHEESIAESIRIILGTAKGERIMRPDFGCGIHDYVFEIINAMTLGNIKSSVEEALVLWEPRIEVLNISVSTEEVDSGKLLIGIDYLISTTNNRFNLVYPFYLTEGD